MMSSLADERAQSEVIGVVLLVLVAVIAAASAFVFLGDVGTGVGEPPLAGVSASTDVVDFGSGGDCTGTGEEVVVEATLISYQNADRIYVLVSDEGGTRKKTVWESPSSSTVGSTKTLANEVESHPAVDVDIGGSGDWAYCPGDEATVEFYAAGDGSTNLLQRIHL
ncbi:MAG: archaellin/type IV pilin N-terminal domain-containing protein [Halobacterium sp.]